VSAPATLAIVFRKELDSATVAAPACNVQRKKAIAVIEAGRPEGELLRGKSRVPYLPTGGAFREDCNSQSADLLKVRTARRPSSR
jgi:hypothetical protein